MGSVISTPESSLLLLFVASWGTDALLELVAHGEADVLEKAHRWGAVEEGKARSRLREIPGHHYVVIQPPLLITGRGSESLEGLRPQPCRCKLPAERVNTRCISNQSLSARLNLTSKL